MRLFSTASFIQRVKLKAAADGSDLLTAARDLAKGIIVGYAVYYGSFLLLAIAAVAVLAFSELLGGPFVAAQVIFFLMVGTIILAGLGGWLLWRKVKEVLHSKRRSSAEDSVREVEVVNGRISHKSEE